MCEGGRWENKPDAGGGVGEGAADQFRSSRSSIAGGITRGEGEGGVNGSGLYCTACNTIHTSHVTTELHTIY